MKYPQTAEAPKSVEQLQADFAKLKFGVIIHYNRETCHGLQWAERYMDLATFNPGVASIDTHA